MSTMREPFAPLLSKLSVVAEGKASAPNEDIKRCIKDCTKDCINEAKTALQFTKKWEESLIGSFDELTRTVDELLGDDKIIKKPPSDFLSSKNGEKLIAITTRVRAMASKVSHDFQSSATTSSPSSPSKDKLESAAHEEDLQRKAEKITAPDPGKPLLQGSYDDLEPQLKECLLCFSAFPENIVIKRRIMIYWWIGEGLVTPTTDGRTAEEVGEDCFKMLISSGLIEPIYQKHSKIAKYCKIHPWARQMLVSKAKESIFFKFDPQDRPTFNTNQCKRACLAAMKEKDQVDITLESNPNELRLLFNLSAQYLSCNKEQLARLKLIYTLLLGRWQNSSRHHIEVEDTKFLDALHSLKELRYLSLQGISRITELPKTITGLTNLLILDLRLCHNLENVTAAVASIKSLTHLDVSECYLLNKMPQGIGSMTNLQVLKGFVVGSARSTDQCRLSELTQLKKLWKLSIRIGSEAQIGEDLNELSEIEKLRSLKITWGHMKSSPSEFTKPKTSRTFSLGKLEKLVLECVPDDDSVSWLTPGGFMELKRLYIAGGKLSQLSLVSEDVRWNVEILRLKFLKELKLEWNYMKRELIQLRCAQIYKCPKIGSSLPGFDENGFWVDETMVPITRTNLELPSDDNA